MMYHKNRILGLILILAQCTSTFVLLTANMDDVKKLARKFVSEPLAQKLVQFIEKATGQALVRKPEAISAENDQNYESAIKDAMSKRYKTLNRATPDPNDSVNEQQEERAQHQPEYEIYGYNQHANRPTRPKPKSPERNDNYQYRDEGQQMHQQMKSNQNEENFGYTLDQAEDIQQQMRPNEHIKKLKRKHPALQHNKNLQQQFSHRQHKKQEHDPQQQNRGQQNSDFIEQQQNLQFNNQQQQNSQYNNQQQHNLQFNNQHQQNLQFNNQQQQNLQFNNQQQQNLQFNNQPHRHFKSKYEEKNDRSENKQEEIFLIVNHPHGRNHSTKNTQFASIKERPDAMGFNHDGHGHRHHKSRFRSHSRYALMSDDQNSTVKTEKVEPKATSSIIQMHLSTVKSKVEFDQYDNMKEAAMRSENKSPTSESNPTSQLPNDAAITTTELSLNTPVSVDPIFSQNLQGFPQDGPNLRASENTKDSVGFVKPLISALV